VTLAHLAATAVLTVRSSHFSAAISAILAAFRAIFAAISLGHLVFTAAAAAIFATSSAILAAIGFGRLAFATISAVFATGFVFAAGSRFCIARFVCRSWGR
jgi:hypothetical protein